MLTEGKKQMIVVAGIYNLLCERIIVRLVVSSLKRNAGCISRRLKRDSLLVLDLMSILVLTFYHMKSEVLFVVKYCDVQSNSSIIIAHAKGVQKNVHFK